MPRRLSPTGDALRRRAAADRLGDWRQLLARERSRCGRHRGRARRGISRSAWRRSSGGLPVFIEKPPAPDRARGGASWPKPRKRAGRAGDRRLHEALFDGQPDRRQRPPSAEFGAARQLPRRVHDGADLFRQEPGLYRLLSASLRALFRSRAAPDGRGRIGDGARRHELAPGKLLLHVGFPLRQRRHRHARRWARTSRAARRWNGGR